MKVLICHERYEPDFGGGGEIIVHQTALELVRLGTEVTVITAGDAAIEQVDGIPTRRLPIGRYRFNLAAAAVTEMARSVDLIQTFNYHACLPALAAGRRAGKPVVCGVLALFGNAWEGMRGPLAGPLFRYWERQLLRREYARVFFLSEHSRRAGIALGIDPARTFVASPGVDCGAFRPAPEKEEAVLFAGKLDPRKGIDELVAVARALPHVRFRVMAWGSHASARPLYAMSNVEMIPFDRKDALRQAFARARIFFFPSRAETYGLVLLEAMASGCAIVSTVELGYQGVTTRPGDVDAMVRAVGELWEDRERTAAMGCRNVAVAAEQTWDRYARILHSAYVELVGSGRAPAAL